MSNEPKHLVVLRDLRTRISDGTWGPGERLPAEEDLALEYGVSRQTLRRAFGELVADGLVDRTRGRGTFVTPSGPLYLRQMGSVDDLLSLSSDTTAEVVTPLRVVVDVNAAARLRLDGDRVGRLTLARLHSGARFCLTDVHVSPATAQALLDEGWFSTPTLTTDTVIGLLEKQDPHLIAEAQQSITAELADAETAAQLDCPVGHPLLRIDRVYHDREGTPVEWATSWFVSERYSYRTVLKRTR